MNLLLSPHDDDNALFAAFTCLREKPLVVVVTDSFVQPNRGEYGCDAYTRAEETRKGALVLGCPVVRLGLRDDNVTEQDIVRAIKNLGRFDTVYAPALQGGNPHHDMVSRAAKLVFNEVKHYTTYTRTELWTVGTTEIVPTEEELNLKYKALNCYESQLKLAATRPHFDAVIGKSEWLI